MLSRDRAAVFSKRAVLGPPVSAQYAGRDADQVRGRREGGSVGRRRLTIGAAEARRKRADALQSDGEADLGDRVVGGSQQRRRPLEPPRQQVGVWRLAEGAAELAAEVCARETGGAGKVVDAHPFEVAGVGKVLGAQEMPCGRDVRHALSLGSAAL